MITMNKSKKNFISYCGCGRPIIRETYDDATMKKKECDQCFEKRKNTKK